MKMFIILVSILGLALSGRSGGAEEKLGPQPNGVQEVSGMLIALGLPNLIHKQPHRAVSRPILAAQAPGGGGESTDSAGGASGADSKDSGPGGAGGSTGDGSEINCSGETPCCCLIGSHAECGDTDACSASGGTCITSIPIGFVKTGNRCRKNP